jgi:hemerythrin-like metal-binding protein
MAQTEQETHRRKKRDAIKHLAVGHDAIDADHKVIVGCCNRLAACTAPEFQFLIRRLRALLADHFQKEAKLLEAIGGALCSCHQRDHDELLDICGRAAKLHLKDHRAAQRLIRDDLARALRLHIAYRDQIIALRLNTTEPGHACPARADDKNRCR